VCGLAECLYHEFAAFGVSVTNALPGFVNTEIGYVTKSGKVDLSKRNLIPEWLAANPEDAAAEIMAAVYARKPEVIVTAHGKLVAALGRYLPRLTRFGQHLTAREVIKIVEGASG
jgi:short-subunit dehydrogenase